MQLVLPFYAVSLVLYNDDLQLGLNQFLLGLVSTQAGVEILKRTIKEQRPNKSNNLSFPSGHTTASFYVANFIHKRYNFAQAFLPYIFASFVAFSRIRTKKHYFHDALAGALFAYTINNLFTSKKIKCDVLMNSNKIKLQFNANFD